jgi:exopolysaccharide biosynthesis WecB/TagA/CpsF family protein
MDYAGACQAIVTAAAEKRSLTVTALAVHGIMTGVLSAEHRKRLNRLDMVLPDGQPVRWALNLLFRAGLPDRVYGPNLMLRVCEAASARGLSVGLYGNRADVLQDLRRNLLERFPDLRLAAIMPSRFGRVSPQEQAELASEIAQTGTDILFVGLGCPRQEVWLYENGRRLAMPTIAVGAAFDFHARRLAQAPKWMQDRGLEWAFRLYHEPRRLWQRYLLLNPLFVTLLVLQFFGLRRAGPVDGANVPYEGYA